MNDDQQNLQEKKRLKGTLLYDSSVGLCLLIYISAISNVYVRLKNYLIVISFRATNPFVARLKIKVVGGVLMCKKVVFVVCVQVIKQSDIFAEQKSTLHNENKNNK